MDSQVAQENPIQKTFSRHSLASTKLNYKQAVLATLAYFDGFEFPLTLDETIHYLFRLEPDRHHIELMLKESGHIVQRGSYYQLRGGKNHIQTRHNRELIAKRLWKKVERYRWVFNLVPYVRLVAVCNTLALNHTDETSDIDLFVLTKKNRLFTGRLLLTWWLHILGVRRHGTKIAGRFCLSFFATEGSLRAEEIEKKPFDIYLAYWFKTLQPIAGEIAVYEQLLADQTPWIHHFFNQPLNANIEHHKKQPTFLRWLQHLQEKILNTRWGDRLEERLARWQIRRAEAKRAALNVQGTDIIVTRDLLKFHNVDRREDVFKTWCRRLAELE